MNFRPELLAKVLNGTKTQTRRIVKPGERLCFNALNGRHYVRAANGHMKWYENGVYAAAPGRSKHGVARFCLLDIRREDVRQISTADAIAEGFEDRADFWSIWLSMHDKSIANREIMVVATDPHSVSTREHIALAYIQERPTERYDAWALTFTLEVIS